MCTEVITEQTRRLKQQWDTALNETNAQQASASCQLCKQLAASSVVAAEFATQEIELALKMLQIHQCDSWKSFKSSWLSECSISILESS